MTIAGTCKTFANSCKISLKMFFWMLHVEHMRVIILDTAKIHKLLLKTETSVLLFSLSKIRVGQASTTKK